MENQEKSIVLKTTKKFQKLEVYGYDEENEFLFETNSDCTWIAIDEAQKLVEFLTIQIQKHQLDKALQNPDNFKNI